MSSTLTKQQILTTFKKTQGLLIKIIDMLEKNDYCIKIMQQNLAAIGLLKSAHYELFENHLNTCFKKGMASKNSSRQRQLIQEILTVSKLSHK